MTPNRAKRLLAVMFTFLLASTAGWCADKEPGGQGTLVSNSHTKHCFETDSSTVQKVCADYQINWKLWTLMGEPVGNYTLSWKLTGIEFRDQRRDGSRLLRFSPDSLPQELQKAASAIELYIDGHVAVDVAMTSSVHLLGLRHRFNTGAAVRAGARQSYNVPGSPSWSNVFVHHYPCKPDAAKESTVDPKTAKEAFKQGINLHSLELCPESGISGLTALENAVDKLCSKPGADGKYAFCPKHKLEKKEAAMADSIEDAFAKLEKSAAKPAPVKPKSIEDGFATLENQLVEQERKRLAAVKAEQDRQARHQKIVQFCEKAISEQESCFQNACGTKPAKEISGGGGCYSDSSNMGPPNAPGIVRASWKGNDQRRPHILLAGSLVFPKCYSTTKPNPQYETWVACTKDIESKCLRGSSARTVAACVRERE